MGGLPNPQKRFYLVYCRKSSESEDRQVESIPDQLRTLNSLVDPKLILKVFKESQSAKAPGRPLFNEMVELIETSEDIKGILCWKLNRLFRNPLDDGKIRWLLQAGKIDEIVTPSKTYYEADSDFVMAVEGAQANRFIRDLREDVKRGLASKVEKGHFPGLAPTGYKNDRHKEKGRKTISPHPVFFSLMRKVFDLALTGNFSLKELTQKANQFGIISSRGKPLSKSQFHRLFQSPFYTGKFLYNGQLYQGQHKPLLAEEEFELLQEILSEKSRPRKQKHEALTGLIRCGCGMMFTYEEKHKTYKNGQSQTFKYYRCSKKSKTKKCDQPWVRAEDLEKQALDYLAQIEISPLFVEWAGKWLQKEREEENQLKEQSRQLLQKQHTETKQKLSKVVEARITNATIEKEEVDEVYNRLKIEKASLETKIAKIDQQFDDLNDLTLKTFDFASKAKQRFKKGSIEDRKIILKAIGSDLTFKGKNLAIQPRTPFLIIKRGLEKTLSQNPSARTQKRGETQGLPIWVGSVSTPWSG